MSFPENLRRFRRQQRYKQSELAELAGLSQVQISRLESGSSAPLTRTVARLAKVLGIKPSDLAAPDEVSESKRRQPG